MNLVESKNALKKVSQFQVEAKFVAELSPKVFTETSVVDEVIDGANCVLNFCQQLFNYFAPTSAGTAKVWGAALKAAIESLLSSVDVLAKKIPDENQEGTLLKSCLEDLVIEAKDIGAILESK